MVVIVLISVVCTHSATYTRKCSFSINAEWQNISLHIIAFITNMLFHAFLLSSIEEDETTVSYSDLDITK